MAGYDKAKNRINMRKNGIAGYSKIAFMSSAKRHHEVRNPHSYADFLMSASLLVWISVWIMQTRGLFLSTSQISTRGEMTYIVILILK